MLRKLALPTDCGLISLGLFVETALSGRIPSGPGAYILPVVFSSSGLICSGAVPVFRCLLMTPDFIDSSVVLVDSFFLLLSGRNCISQPINRSRLRIQNVRSDFFIFVFNLCIIAYNVYFINLLHRIFLGFWQEILNCIIFRKISSILNGK